MRIKHIKSQRESSVKLSVSTIRMGILLFMKRWFEWRKILVIVIYSLMVTVISVLLTVIQRRQCVIRKQKCLNYRWNFYVILIKIRLIILTTMMDQNENQSSSRLVFRTYSSMVHQE